jgi:hypothetical protein
VDHGAKAGCHGGVLRGMSLPISSPCAPSYSVAKSSEYVAKIQASLSLRRSSPENIVSIVLVIPLAKSVGACVFEWFLGEANNWYQS